MKIKIKGTVKERIWEWSFIFITIFYSFYNSIFSRNVLISIIGVMFAAIVVVGILYKQKGKLSKIEILTFIIVWGFSFLNIIFFKVPLNSVIRSFLFIFIPMIIAGGIIDLEKNHAFIYWVSCFYIIFLLCYLVFYYSRISTTHHDYIDYMGFAYYAIPSLMIIVYEFFRKRTIISFIMAVIGGGYLIMCGTRGPILCTALFGCFCMFMYIKNGSTKQKVGIMLLILTGIIVLLNLRSIAVALYPVFARHNLSTRFFKYVIESRNVLEGTGRMSIYKVTIDNIKSHPLLGTGLFSDRKLFGGNDTSYSHNFILEIINSYGILLGCSMLILLFGLVVQSYRKTDSEIYRYYIVIYFTASVVKLMLSYTFLGESTLYILIGICFAALRKAGHRNCYYEYRR